MTEKALSVQLKILSGPRFCDKKLLKDQTQFYQVLCDEKVYMYRVF